MLHNGQYWECLVSAAATCHGMSPRDQAAASVFLVQSTLLNPVLAAYIMAEDHG